MMICNSGGAIGSDMAFERECLKNGIEVRAYSFEGHKTNSTKRIILSEAELLKADELLIEANKSLKRYIPFHKPWIMNLLRRNYYQIIDAQAIFAIGRFDTKNYGCVEGGTGWAIEMAKVKKIPIFVYNQGNLEPIDGFWFEWNYDKSCWAVRSFQEIEDRIKELNFEVFAGVGTRNLDPEGERNIAKIVKLIASSNIIL